MIVMIADVEWIGTQDAAESLRGGMVFANSDDADSDALFKVWRSPTELKPVGAPCEEREQGGNRIPTDESIVFIESTHESRVLASWSPVGTASCAAHGQGPEAETLQGDNAQDVASAPETDSDYNRPSPLGAPGENGK